MKLLRFCWAFVLLLAPISTHAAATGGPILKVLTLNVAGVPLVHRHWTRRLDAIIARLKNDSPYDIVALQELWLDKDADRVIRESGYPYSLRQGDGIAGNGLLILSRYNIIESGAWTFSVSPPTLRKAISQGDSIASKGLLFVRLDHPSGELDVYNTHFVADYPGDSYETIRLTQVAELYKAVIENSLGRPVIIMGDLNTDPGDTEYRILRSLLGLWDVCQFYGTEVCPDSHRIGRVDHILVPEDVFGAYASLDFTGTIPKTSIRFSDHMGVAANFSSDVFTTRLSLPPENVLALMEIEERIGVFARAVNQHAKSRTWIPLIGLTHEAAFRSLLTRLEAVRQKTLTLLLTRRNMGK